LNCAPAHASPSMSSISHPPPIRQFISPTPPLPSPSHLQHQHDRQWPPSHPSSATIGATRPAALVRIPPRSKPPFKKSSHFDPPIHSLFSSSSSFNRFFSSQTIAFPPLPVPTHPPSLAHTCSLSAHALRAIQKTPPLPPDLCSSPRPHRYT
jgi:hypothetical protein